MATRLPRPAAPTYDSVRADLLADTLRDAMRSGLAIVLACAVGVAAVALLLRLVID